MIFCSPVAYIDESRTEGDPIATLVMLRNALTDSITLTLSVWYNAGHFLIVLSYDQIDLN